MMVESSRRVLSGGGVAIWALSLFWGPVAPSEHSRHMLVGGTTLAPEKFISFCIAKPKRCASSKGALHVALDKDKLNQLASVHEAVDSSIAPVAHDSRPWRDDAKAGDCVEYALAKRSHLLDMGWPPGTLLLAEAVVPGDEHHLVLVVVTDNEDLVLDNLRQDVAPLDSLPYRWVRRSSPSNPQFWQTIVSPA
jgi:predicted transglutaminase-like cysteine proteinase